MKISRIGWIGKGIKLKDIIWEGNEEWEISVCTVKNPFSPWVEGCYPPRRISITLEDTE